MKKNINIAVAFWGINDEYQGKICRGISKRIHELKNITVSYFASFLTNFSDDAVATTENVIYSLINFDFFDALIVIPYNFNFNDVAFNDLLSRAKAADVPVFSLDKLTEGCINLLIDNDKAVFEIIDHVIEVHHARDIVYVGGIKDSGWDLTKINYIKDSAKRHGFECDPRRIWGEYYDGASKRELIKFLDEDNEPLPDAFICANDSMAIGICWELESRGIRIPEDVIVTGFDGIMANFLHDPIITTVEVPYTELGYKSVDVILDYLANPLQDIKTLEEKSLIHSHPDFYGSCGCFNHDKTHRNQIAREVCTTMYRNVYMNDYIVKMATSLALCDTLEDFYKMLEKTAGEIAVKEIYICYNEEYLHNYSVDDPLLEDYTIPQRTEFSETIGARVIVDDNNVSHPMQVYPKKDILPALHEESEQSREFFFMPLHFLLRTYGYIACETKGGGQSRSSDMFNLWANFIALTQDSVRERMRTKRYTGILEKLHKIDPLTQVYNRRGFLEERDALLEHYKDSSPDIMLLLIDLDDMKGINDTFGHAAGDDALITVTDSLKSVAGKSDIICRFGGDEFIMFGVGYDEVRAEEMISRLNQTIEKRCAEIGFSLTVSSGICIKSFDDVCDFETMAAIADEDMYAKKNAKQNRKQHTLKP